MVAAGEGDSFVATFCFPPAFSGFNGHFPNQPVLPGVCLVQAVLAAAEMALKQKLNLTEIVLTKFIAVVLPNEEITAVCSVRDQVIRATLSRGKERIAEIRLRVNDAQTTSGRL